MANVTDPVEVGPVVTTWLPMPAIVTATWRLGRRAPVASTVVVIGRVSGSPLMWLGGRVAVATAPLSTSTLKSDRTTSAELDALHE